MIPEVEREALQSLSRLELEGLQMHTRYLRDYVDNNAHTLPLRHIYGIGVAEGVVYFKQDEETPSTQLHVHEQTVEDAFHRLNHAFVKRMGLDFLPENRPFLAFLHARANRLLCHIQALRVNHIDKSIDYALLDFIGSTFRPREVELKMRSATPDDVVMLFTRTAFCHTVENIMYKFYEQTAPRCIIPKLLHADNLKTCVLSVRTDPRPWIVEFIQEFETVSHETHTVYTVAIVHRRRAGAAQLLDDFYPLIQSSGIEVPVPSGEALEAWRHDPYDGQAALESPTARRVVFANTAAKKKLETYVWTVGLAQAVHYTYLLRIMDA